MTRIDCREISDEAVDQSEAVRRAYDSIVKNGYVVLDHVIDAQKAAALNDEFCTRYHNYFQNSELPDTMKVGNKRYLMTLELSGGFADVEVYANRFIVAVAQLALGGDAVLESFGAVVSLPGAKQQHIHRDGPLLFDAGISPILPCHALTVAMPLIDMNENHGCTAIWSGSHRWKERNEEVPPVAPEIPAGSCALWDFRLYHGGTPNQSDRVRPLVYGTFARRWYQDPNNFPKKGLRRLAYTQEFLDGVPESRRNLFYHVLKPD